MISVSCAKCVIYIEIAVFCKFISKSHIIVFCFFSLIITDVF